MLMNLLKKIESFGNIIQTDLKQKLGESGGSQINGISFLMSTKKIRHKHRCIS